MTAARHLETGLPEILEEISVPRTPAYFDDILGQVGRTRQRPRWTFIERWLPMTAISERVATAPRIPMRLAVGLALLLLALAVSIVLIAGRGRTVPPPYGPAANGALVVAEGGDIYLIDPVSGVRTLAIGGPTEDSEAVFSRDGTRIAFFREDSGRRGLFVADDRGRGVRQLDTTGLVDPNTPQWSPDGRSILVNTTAIGQTTAAIVDVDGRAPRPLDPGMPAEDAVWLPPDGREILFRSPGSVGYGLHVAAVDGSGVRTLIPATGMGEWDALFFAPSPDGSLVAYQWRDVNGVQKIYVVPTSGGGEPRPVTSIESVLPRWSPDGKLITFGSDPGMYVVRADGSEPEWQLVPVPEAAGSLRSTWSPDGRKVLFLNADGKPFLIDPTGGPPIEASWTAADVPDWQRVAAPA